jgi:phosphohistidine phosphatase
MPSGVLPELVLWRPARAQAWRAAVGVGDAGVMSTPQHDRTLVLLRHAKAERVPGKADLDRELTARGHRDAMAAGEWLAQHVPPIDRVVCSTSVRARQTWEGVRRGGVSATSVDLRAEVYDAAPGTLLDVVRGAPEQVRCLLLVGHAPGVPLLVEELVAPGAAEPMPHGCPTSGCAVLRFAGAWSTLAPGGAELERFVVARAG